MSFTAVYFGPDLFVGFARSYHLCTGRMNKLSNVR
jgi:hypothetical protein